MRSFIASSALLAAAATATEPIVSFGADSVSIDIPSNMTNAQLTAFAGGQCGLTNATLDSATAGNINVAFPISSCALAMGDVVTFSIGANTQDDSSNLLSLSFFEYAITLDPEYTFTINFNYGNIAVVTKNLTDTDLDVQFSLQAFDENYSSSLNISDQLAGDMVYLGLSVDETNAAFDHSAYNFAMTNCKIYHAGDRSFEYTFFDNSRDSCSNPMIEFEIDFNTAANQWRFNHMLFLLNNQDGAEQEIECEVKVCHAALVGSSCEAAAGNCLHCKNSPCGANGSCAENATYDGFDCSCDDGFTGALCDTAV